MQIVIRRGCGKSLPQYIHCPGVDLRNICIAHYVLQLSNLQCQPSSKMKKDHRLLLGPQRFGSQEQEPVCQQSSWCCAPPACRRAKGYPIPPQPQFVGSHQGFGPRTSSSPAQPRGAQPITARPKQLCLSKAAFSSSPICCSLAQKQQQSKALGICHPGPLCIQSHPTCLELPLSPE